MPDCAAEFDQRKPRSEEVDEVLAALKRLRALGMKLAEQLVDEVRTQTDEAPARSPADIAIAFQRISKAVRMTAALELRVLEAADEARLIEGQARRRLAERQAAERRSQGRQKRLAAIEVVSGLLAETDGDLEGERYAELDETLHEWSYDEREDEDFAHMDERQMLEAICEGLGLVPDPKLWDAGEYGQAIACAILKPPIPEPSPAAKAAQAARAHLAATGPPP